MKHLYLLRIALCLLPFNVFAMDNIINGYEFSTDQDLNGRIHANLAFFDLIDLAFSWSSDPEGNVEAYNELLDRGFTESELSEALNTLRTFIANIVNDN